MKKKTKEEIEAQLNNEYSIIGDFKNTSMPTLVRHNKCGYEWTCKIETLTRKTKPVKCPRCNSNRWDDTRFKEFLKSCNITSSDTFVNIQTPMTYECNKCHHIWSSKPANLIYNGTRCPNCLRTSQTLTDAEFRKRLDEKYHGEYIAVSKYINSSTKIKIRHTPCRK